jgi:DNA adenine methylase
MRDDIFAASHLLRGRTIITSKDYREVIDVVSKNDILYMDPPYQGVSYTRDPRYYNGMDFDAFIQILADLRERRIPFILSYDGRTGQKNYGKPLPHRLGLQRIEVHAGRSTQSTLLGGEDITYESIYLSGELTDRLACHPDEIERKWRGETRFECLFM